MAEGVMAPTTASSVPRTPVEKMCPLRDGVELFYRAWLPDPQAERALLLFHRGHEHSGRFQDVVEALNLPSTAIFAWDARGHGRTSGKRGYADHFSVFVSDLDAFVEHVSREHEIPVENMVVLAHSVGAVMALAWVHDYAPPIRGIVLATPALRVKLYVPFAIPLCRLLLKIKGSENAFLKSYVKPKMLTHDPAQAKAYAEDPLIRREIAVNVLVDLHDTSTRLIKDAGAIEIPTLLLLAGSDWVVSRRAQRRLLQRLSSRLKEIRELPGFYHDVLHEKERNLALDPARHFILNAFEREPDRSHLLEADRSGFTKREFEHLQTPLGPLSPRRWSFALQKLMLGTLGRLSRGIRVGWQAGFDSGRSLDYVYENEARGTTPLGRLIDRAYLDSPGWVGIRQRAVHLQQLLRAAIETLQREGRPVRILDIAAGPGRYVLDAMMELPDADITAVLRDRDEAGLAEGRALARARGLDERVRHEAGDAFDAPSIASVSPRPTIGVVSGLYELFPGNEPILRSLRGLAEAIEDDGYLIYTNQPWHPQIEMIARVLTNREGKPWIMRRRTQAEMDALVAAAGFVKQCMLIDRYGIFTVSLARKK